MTEEKKVFEYDEDESIVFIQNHLTEELRGKFSNDEVNYVVDLIYEYYESEGFFDNDDDSDIEIDIDEMLDFVIENAKKDKVRDFTEDELESIVAGELAYCDTLNIFE